MSYSIKWQVEPRIILLETWGEITSDEIQQQLAEILQMLNDAPHKADIIVDTRRIEKPSLVNPLGFPGITKYLKHPNRGWVVFISTTNSLVNFWVQVFVKVGLKTTFIDSIEDATVFLQTMSMRAEQGASPARR